MPCSTHRVYHGTPRAFDKLEESQTGGRFQDVNVPREGIWFTTDFQEAMWYATHPRRTDHSRVLMAEVTLCRPYVTDPEEYANEGISEALPNLSRLKREGYDGVIVLRADWVMASGSRVLHPGQWYLEAMPPHIAAFSAEQVQLIASVPAQIWEAA